MKSNKKEYFITIDNPCQEDWDLMVPNSVGRHCSSCNKTVIDFSILSDDDIIKIISEERGKAICGQFHSHQLNRWITEKSIEKTNPQLYKVVLSLLLLTSSVELSAQQKPLEQSVQTSQSTKSGDSLNSVERNVTNISSDLQPVTPLDSNVKKQSRQLLRGGISSICNSDPLIVIDGVIYQNAILQKIPAEKIKSLDILKGASATALYGESAAHGVIIIKSSLTKKEKKHLMLSQ